MTPLSDSDAARLHARLRELAAVECPAWGPRAVGPDAGAGACDLARSLSKLQAAAVLDLKADEFNFQTVFRDALLASSSAESSGQRRTKNADAMEQFQQRYCIQSPLCRAGIMRSLTCGAPPRRLSDLPLSLIHLAVDPYCYAGASASDAAAGGSAGEDMRRSIPPHDRYRAAAPNLKLPKSNISRFLMRRLRPLYSKFICEVVAPDVAAAMAPCPCSSVFYQTSPCLRMSPPSTIRATHPHCDAM
jgi:hypothetical protein